VTRVSGSVPGVRFTSRYGSPSACGAPKRGSNRVAPRPAEKITRFRSWRLPLETRRRIREAEETGATALDLSHLKALLENIPLASLGKTSDVAGGGRNFLLLQTRGNITGATIVVDTIASIRACLKSLMPERGG